jgi:carbon storage regulator CsrA
MLVLTRTLDDKTIHIGPDITVTLERVTREGKARIGVVAPDHVAIVRGEMVAGGQYPLGEAVPVNELVEIAQEYRKLIAAMAESSCPNCWIANSDQVASALDAVLSRIRRKPRATA